MIEITQAEYDELKFTQDSLFEKIKELIKEADRLNRISFKTTKGEEVQNLEWVTLRYKISTLLQFVPENKIMDLYK